MIWSFIRIDFKTSGLVRGRGANRFKSGAYTIVFEHFETVCNNAIGQEMMKLKSIPDEGAVLNFL